MQAVKDNRVYTITEADVEPFRKEGYDIFDGGKLVAYGVGKKVPYEKYASLMADYEKMIKENARLTDELAKAKKATSRKTTKKEED